jgi:hypothetical protein
MLLLPTTSTPLDGKNSPPIAIFQSLKECHACLDPHHYLDLHGLNPPFLGYPEPLPRYTFQVLPVPSTYWTSTQYEQRDRPEPIEYATVDTCYYLQRINNMIPSPYDSSPQDADTLKWCLSFRFGIPCEGHREWEMKLQIEELTYYMDLAVFLCRTSRDPLARIHLVCRKPNQVHPSEFITCIEDLLQDSKSHPTDQLLLHPLPYPAYPNHGSHHRILHV